MVTEDHNGEWYQRPPETKGPVDPKLKKEAPDGLWINCKHCGETLYAPDVENNMYVCLQCGYHMRLNYAQRIELLIDKGTFKEIDGKLTSGDPLNFVEERGAYSSRLKASKKKTNINEAFVFGTGKMEGMPVALGVLDFSFFGGSMGSAVGEKVTRLIEVGIRKKIPVIIVSASGGARMQEGIYSLMQMAKTSAALAKLRRSKIPYISVLTDPTTGGVTASFSMLGDIHITEPNALIGFAGPRVIEQTIRQKLPPGFQRSEFLHDHGFIDVIVERKDMKATIAHVLELLYPSKTTKRAVQKSSSAGKQKRKKSKAV